MLQVDGQSVPRDAGHPHYPFNEPFWGGIVQEDQCLESHITNKCDKCHKCTLWSPIIWCVWGGWVARQQTIWAMFNQIKFIFCYKTNDLGGGEGSIEQKAEGQSSTRFVFYLLSLIMHTMRIKSFQKANMYCKHSMTKLRWNVRQVALKQGATVGLFPSNHDHSCLHGQ